MLQEILRKLRDGNAVREEGRGRRKMAGGEKKRAIIIVFR